MTVFSAVLLSGALLVLVGGYLLGVHAGRGARDALRNASREVQEELLRLRERVSRNGDGDPLRTAVQKALGPLVQRDYVSVELARIACEPEAPQELERVINQFAVVGRCLTVLLSDDQGRTLAANDAAMNLEKLGATASMCILLSDKLARDGSAPPTLFTLHDASSVLTLCRIFQVDTQRLAFTVVSPGALVTVAALEQFVGKLGALLRHRIEATAASSVPG